MDICRVILASIAAACLPAAPALAQEAGLSCMQASYDASGQARIDELTSPSATTAPRSARAQIADLALQAALDCGDSLGWPSERAQWAYMYELGRLSELNLRANGGLSETELARLDRELARGDYELMWRIMERSMASSIAGEPAQFSDEESALMGQFALNAGFTDGDTEVNEQIGELLGAMTIQRIARNLFNGALEDI